RANRHVVGGVAIFVNKFVKQPESAGRVTAGDVHHGRAPLAMDKPAPGNEIRIGERPLSGTRFEIVEHAHLPKISSQVAIVTLVYGDKGILRGDSAEQARGFSAAIEVIPRLDHLSSLRLAPGVENLLQPLLCFPRRYADRSRGFIN